MAIYTVGIWRVKPGDQDAFVAAWRAMATNTKLDHPQASAVLLRDRDAPELFVSAGPWESLEQIEAWRASATFATGAEGIRPHLNTFEPHTMDLVVAIGEQAP